jgi:dTMP kinase
MIAVPGFERRRHISRHIRDLIRNQEAKRGLLIAFEGPDGSGKTTQRKLFKSWLKSEGQDVITTKWNSSELMKPVVKARKAAHSLSPQEYSLLHAADFRYRLETDILPALWEGKTVIADRYLFTALARDSARGLPLDWLLKIYSPVFWPDMVLYFSVSPEVSGARIAADRDPSFYEAGQDVTNLSDPQESYQQFISRVIREYESLALIFRFAMVDAAQPIYEQHRVVRSLYLGDRRRPWADRNEEALVDWLVQNPRLAGE